MKFIKEHLHFLLPIMGIVILLSCAQNTPEAVFNRGLRAFEEGDFLGASIYFEEFINKFPEDERALDAHIALAQSFLRINDYANARTIYENMKEKYDNPQVDLSAEFGIAETYFQEGYIEEAVNTYEEIANATDNAMIDIRVYSRLGDIYASQKNLEESVDMYENVYQIANQNIENPTNELQLKVRALSSQAQVYQASEEFEQARELHKKVLDVIENATQVTGLEMDKQNAVLNWAHTYAWAGDYVSSATIYDQLHNNPYIQENVKPKLIMWKVQSLERLFYNEEGEEQYSPEETAVLVNELKRLTEGFPETEAATNAMTQIAQLVKDTTPEMAEEYLQKAVSEYEEMIAEPDSPERPIMALLQIADAYIRTENYDRAKQTLERVMQTYSNVPRAVQQAKGMLDYINRAEAEGQQLEGQQPEGEVAPAPQDGDTQMNITPPGEQEASEQMNIQPPEQDN